MNISLCSDLHLEFQPCVLPGGDVLILSGDIAEARHMERDYKSDKIPPYPVIEGFSRYRDFFEIECAKYNQVFYVMGNHEHYGGRLDRTYSIIKDILPFNVTILENELVEYNNVIFMGATLWTDLNRNDPMTALVLKDFLNDFRVITNLYANKGIYTKLTPQFTSHVHRTTLDFFAEQLEQNRDKQFVIMTHHAPSYKSIHEQYKEYYEHNGGYASDLSNFIFSNPNIKVWTHGHVHTPFNYTIGETRILCNPRGYPNENSDFKVLDFELCV